MPCDRRCAHSRALRPLVGPAGHEAHLGARRRRYAEPVGQPRENTDQRRMCGRSGRSQIRVADQANELREALIASRRRTGHCFLQTPLAPLPDAAGRVDHEVVRDVGPPLVGTRVICVPASEDRGHIGSRMAVVRCRVVDEEKPHVLRGNRPGRWLGRPCGPRVDGEPPCRQGDTGAGDHHPGGGANELASGQGHGAKPYI